MKPLYVSLSLTCLFLFSSCRSLTFFESPNSLRNIDGTLHLHNGQSVGGKLVVQTDNLLGSPVKVYTDGNRKPMQFTLAGIKGYTIRNETYEVKEIHEGFPLGRQQFFMRRLTPANSRMHLYEFLHRHTINKTAARYEPEYYLQLPGDEHNFVYATNGSRFVPNFDQKVSQLVSDCAPLAKKIRDKKDGYFYAQVSLIKEKRVDVLLRIIGEYNNCE